MKTQSRRQFMASIVAMATATLTGSALAAPAAARKKPNILFIMSDDHTTQAIGAYGSRLAKLNPTPTIDTLAKEGMLFENVICTNSICVPSRACIMTGQYSHINGCISLSEGLPVERQYLAKEMKEAGYLTAIVGKWHLKERPSSFDYYKVLPGQGKYFDPEFYEIGKEGKITMTGHSSDCIADSALTWLKGRDTSKPFFLKLHFKAPHDFFDNAHRYDNYLEDVKIPEPESMYEQGNHGSIATRGHDDELVRYVGTSIGRRNLRRNYTHNYAKDETLTDDQAKSLAYQTYLKKYLRCVKGVDDNLARVFDYLRKQGLYDNTVIFYTGDQGMWLGEHDYQDKRWGYEESLKMPLLVRYPRTIAAGSRTDAIVENIDFAPTMLDFAGARTPGFMQGRSFKRILETRREPANWKKEAYYQYWMHMAHHDNPAHIGMRTKRYKLLFFYGTRKYGNARNVPETTPTPPGWELYDLKNDPQEMNNVYDDPQYATVVKNLKRRFKDLRARIKVDNPSAAPNDRVREEMITANKVINEFWDYDESDRKRAVEISHEYLKKASQALKKRR